MIWLNDKISIRQLQVLLILNIFGTGIILLPRYVVQQADQDGWIVVVLATIFAVFCLYIIATLGRMFPTKSFYEYASIIVTKPIAFILSIGFVVRLILHIALELRVFGEIVSQTMLYKTPFYIICICVLLLAGYASSKGYETRARLGEILIFLVLIPITLVFLVAAFNVDYTNILPVMQASPQRLLTGGFYTLSAFVGIELVLLVYPYITKPNNVKISTIHAVLILGLFMTIITIITIARFGIYDINNQMWPVIEMMDSTALPGSFMQRQGVFIMSFFIISVFAIVNAGLFFSSLILKSIFKKGKHIYYTALVMLITFFVSLAPQNMVQVYKYLDNVFITFGIAYMLIIPCILLLIAKARGLGERYGKS